jgi:hypothetical protein
MQGREKEDRGFGKPLDSRRAVMVGAGRMDAGLLAAVRRYFSSVGRRLSGGKAWQLSSDGQDSGRNTSLGAWRRYRFWRGCRYVKNAARDDGGVQPRLAEKSTLDGTGGETVKGLQSPGEIVGGDEVG